MKEASTYLFNECITGGSSEEKGRGNGRDKGRGRGRGGRGRMDENAVQKCVFEKLSLVDKDGTPIPAEIAQLIDTYTGDDEVGQLEAAVGLAVPSSARFYFLQSSEVKW